MALAILMQKTNNSTWLTTPSSTADNAKTIILESSSLKNAIQNEDIGALSVPILTYGGVAVLGIWAATSLIKALTELVKACQE